MIPSPSYSTLLDRPTHHVHVLEMNDDSYCLAQAERRIRRTKVNEPPSGSDDQK